MSFKIADWLGTLGIAIKYPFALRITLILEFIVVKIFFFRFPC